MSRTRNLLRSLVPALVLPLLLVLMPGSAGGVTSHRPGAGLTGLGLDDATQDVASMAVYGPNLYVGTENWAQGCELWSYDGESWTRIAADGLGDEGNDGLLSMAVFGSKLYLGTSNWDDGCSIFSYDGKQLQELKSEGLGDRNNVAVTSLAVFEGMLYAGIENEEQGCEIWRTADGRSWNLVRQGGFGDAANMGASSMAVFGSNLYVGTARQTGGCEIWRSASGTAFTKVNNAGFGDANNTIASSMAVFGSRLYVGVYNGVAGCELWRSADGTAWSKIGANGFGDTDNIDISSLAVIGSTLLAGTSNATEGAAVMGSTNGTPFAQVNAPGFGKDTNTDVSAMAPFGEGVVAGTRGWQSGCEVWGSGLQGGPPYTDWSLLMDNGFAGATWYMAEGSTFGGYETWILVQNPGVAPASVDITYMTGGGEQQGPSLTLPPSSRASVNVGDTVQTFDVSTKVEADRQVVCERAVYLDNRECATGSIGATAPGDNWYIAEGCSALGFTTWILVQNPSGEDANVSIEYQTGDGAVFGPDLTVPAKSRRTINIADTVVAADVSTMVSSDIPVVVERAQYFGTDRSATGSLGVTGPAEEWYMPEGSTYGGFETWILVQNPGDDPADVSLTYMTGQGRVQGPQFNLPGRTRQSISVADTVQTFDVSTLVTADQPVVAERSVYFMDRLCATGSIGAPEPLTGWHMAEGSTAGGFETWILIMNPGTEPAHAELTYMTSGGAVAGPALDVAPGSRVSVNVGNTVSDYSVSTVVNADRPVVCERAVYFNNRQCATGSIGSAVD